MKLTKVCRCCGKIFETNNPQKLYCDSEHWLPCPICGKPVLKKDRDFTIPPKCCSRECSEKLTRRNLPIRKCEICGNLFKPNSGVATICELPHFRKCEVCGNEFLLTKDMYHDNVTTCSAECKRKKRRRKNLEKCEVPYQIQFDKILDEIGIKYQPRMSLSSEIFDFHVTGTNILININNGDLNNVSCDRHLKQTLLAEERGFRCIHIFPWDNAHKIANMVRPAENVIRASDCTLFRIRPQPSKDFLENYCLDGFSNSDVLSLGLVYNSEILAVMTFRSAEDDIHSIELSRFAVKPTWRIYGGFGKLFKFATEDFYCENIVCNLDRSKFSGAALEAIGMTKISDSEPRLMWSRGNQMIMDDALDESSMIKNGWIPIYNCGTSSYEYK